ncbi:MAG: L,D-transpeptidase family protein [Sulfurovum sp.]|nr:L,D-transpeptidase family protein [Sulfurovum sp.]
MKRLIIVLLVMSGVLLIVPSMVGAEEHKWASGASGIDFIDDASIVLEKAVKKSNNSFFKKLYTELFYTPVWIDKKGLTHFGSEMMKVVGEDKTLLPLMQSSKYYELVKEKLKILKENEGGSLEDKVALELELSHLYKAYADYMIYGGINWTAFKSKLAKLKRELDADFGWIIYAPHRTTVSVLMDAIALGSFKKGIKNAEPKHFNYPKLKKYLLKYIKIEKDGSWKKLPKYSKKLKSGKSSAAIPMIRYNLALEGDLGSCRGEMNSTLYDKCLVKAVKRFQLRNGVKSDGVIGKSTYTLMDIPVSKKITLIRMNMDRIKRLREDNSKVRMELNIPSYRLNIFDGSKLVDTIRVVTGKRKHPTPIFGNKVQYIVVNPWWKIPESIVKKEMLRNLIKNPYYYEKRGKILKRTWDENSERIDPGTISWSQYRAKSARIPYRFMQVPSRRNALGKIKFIFPNKFSVYIHDTPSKKLFFKTDRAFSHGCMRIQKPRELLKAFSLYNDNIDVEAIMKRLQGTKKKIVHLKHKIPIDITYLTAFVDPYGNMNFRKDVYRYDKYTLKDYKHQVDRYKRGQKSKKTETSKKIEKNIKKSTKKMDKDGYSVSEVYSDN